ncbi:MAG: HDOD domain-containing protein [Thermodesulfobacteriota bacterium]
MTEPTTEPNQQLAEIFAKINMSDLPAMSEHVRELIAVTSSSQSAAYELAKVILKDYSLTNKILRVVNSAYYSMSRPVSSISRAVSVIGFDAVRELAMAITLFEDFIKSGVEKEGIAKLLTKSFLAAMQAKTLGIEKKLRIVPEEAFICTLLHDLGKMIVLIYLPDLHREIQERVEAGQSEEAAARAVLSGLTLPEVGEEIARFWNLSEKIVAAMGRNPPPPHGGHDEVGYLRNLAVFSNNLTEAVSEGRDVASLVDRFGPVLAVDRKEALDLVSRSVECSEDLSDALRYGLAKLKMRSRLKSAQDGTLEKATRGEATPEESSPLDAVPAGVDELPTQPDKSINDFIRELTETLMGPFNLNDFYVNLLEALYRGVGFDRVIMAVLQVQPDRVALIGRYGLGDISPAAVRSFEHPLANPEHAVTRAVKTGRDLAIPANAPGLFPDQLRHLVRNRAVYLFPVVVDKKPIGLIYVDRKAERPPLDESRLKATRLLRDFAVMAIRKLKKR